MTFDLPKPEPHNGGNIYVDCQPGHYNCGGKWISECFVAKWVVAGDDRCGVWVERSTPKGARAALDEMLRWLE